MSLTSAEIYLDKIDVVVLLVVVHCTLYIVHCTLYIVHCTLYIVHCIGGKQLFVENVDVYVRILH